MRVLVALVLLSLLYFSVSTAFDHSFVQHVRNGHTYRGFSLDNNRNIYLLDLTGSNNVNNIKIQIEYERKQSSAPCITLTPHAVVKGSDNNCLEIASLSELQSSYQVMMESAASVPYYLSIGNDVDESADEYSLANVYIFKISWDVCDDENGGNNCSIERIVSRPTETAKFVENEIVVFSEKQSQFNFVIEESVPAVCINFENSQDVIGKYRIQFGSNGALQTENFTGLNPITVSYPTKDSVWILQVEETSGTPFTLTASLSVCQNDESRSLFEANLQNENTKEILRTQSGLSLPIVVPPRAWNYFKIQTRDLLKLTVETTDSDLVIFGSHEPSFVNFQTVTMMSVLSRDYSQFTRSDAYYVGVFNPTLTKTMHSNIQFEGEYFMALPKDATTVGPIITGSDDTHVFVFIWVDAIICGSILALNIIALAIWSFREYRKLKRSGTFEALRHNSDAIKS